METKKWYQSKTLLANLCALVGVPASTFAGVVDKETAIVAVVGALVNIALRFKTKHSLA